MLSTCLLRATSLPHLVCLSPVLWCAAGADKQRCKTLSAWANLSRVKLSPVPCQLGTHGEDDWREVQRGTNSSSLPESDGVRGTERLGAFRVSSNAFIYLPDLIISLFLRWRWQNVWLSSPKPRHSKSPALCSHNSQPPVLFPPQVVFASYLLLCLVHF